MSFVQTVRALTETSSFDLQRFDFLKDGSKIALYGAGSAGRDMARALVGAGYPVSCFLDCAAQTGAVLDGFPLLHPDDVSLAPTRGQVHVLISIFNPTVDVAPLAASLKSAGWRSVTSFVEIHRRFPELGPRYWLVSPDFYTGKMSEILSAHEIWADDKSRELYEACFKFRLNGDCQFLPSPDPRQYFPPDVPSATLPLRMIDCGAFNGDTLKALEQSNLNTGAIAAFEPDMTNFAALLEVRQSPFFDKVDITLWPCGVSARTGQLRFSSGHGAGSSLARDGAETIQCVALDDSLSSFHPTFLKMDIEGAEFDALHGAASLIKKNRPNLAVCVYHFPHDIWRIPALLQSWNLGYRFYLRSHAFNGFDMVLYAVSRQPNL